MKFTHFTQKIKSLPNLKVIKRIHNNKSAESYWLLYGNNVACTFDFTNYKLNDRYVMHGEVKNFKINDIFRRTTIGVKALLQAKDIITASAKDKNLTYVMFQVKNQVEGNIGKLIQHLGAVEQFFDDFATSHFLYLINPKFYKKVQKKLLVKPDIKINLLSSKSIEAAVNNN